MAIVSCAKPDERKKDVNLNVITVVNGCLRNSLKHDNVAFSQRTHVFVKDAWKGERYSMHGMDITNSFYARRVGAHQTKKKGRTRYM